MPQFKHLTRRDRDKMEALLNIGATKKYIADYLGVHLSTIYRELKRGQYERMRTDLTTYLSYSSDIAQNDYDYKQTSKGAPLKIGNAHDLAAYITDMILHEHYSPDAIMGYIKAKDLTFSASICTKTLYNYINSGVFYNLSSKHLLRRGRFSKHVENDTPRHAKRPLCRSIHERPQDAKARSSVGHWEMDTVVSGQNYSTCLLVLTERLTRHEIIKKIPSKTQLSVKIALQSIIRQYGKAVFKTITSDNGSEFLNTKEIESLFSPEFVLYYADPYSAWQRGSNENQNTMIRRYIPKGSNIAKYSHRRIQEIENWINNYPRKILNYASSAEQFSSALKNF